MNGRQMPKSADVATVDEGLAVEATAAWIRLRSASISVGTDLPPGAMPGR